ncbi:MAG: hypothetical protein RL247_26 [Actinomycetota bacterium]
MSIPTRPGPLDEGDDLVEPPQPEPTLDLGSLDTGRILQDTPSLPALDDEQEHNTAVDTVDASVSGTDTSHPEKPDSSHSPAGLNILSVVALVLALTLSPFAVLFGYLSIGQIRRSRQRGHAFAWVAIGLGWLWLVAYTVAGIVLAMTWLQVM